MIMVMKKIKLIFFPFLFLFFFIFTNSCGTEFCSPIKDSLNPNNKLEVCSSNKGSNIKIETCDDDMFCNED